MKLGFMFMGLQNIFVKLILMNFFREFTLLVLHNIGIFSPYSSNNTQKENVYCTSMHLPDLIPYIYIHICYRLNVCVSPKFVC